MKKLLLLSLIGLSINANAQITITSADIATPTKVIFQADDTMPTISVGSPGTGLTWNFSSLSNDSPDTLTFRPYSDAPNASFTSANLLVQQGSQPLYSYAVNSSSSLVNLGVNGTINFDGTPTQYKSTNSPAETLALFPMMYTNNFTNDFVTTIYPFGVNIPYGPFTIDSLRSKSTVHKTGLVDAWGTLTTPLGTYNVLRVKEIIVKHDTTDAYIAAVGGWQNGIVTGADSSASYVWWANGIGFPLVQARMDSLGNVRNVEWLQALPMAVGVNELSAAAINVYPNPAQEQINFATDAKIVKAVQVYDVTGRQVVSFTVNSDISTINTSNYANGTYSYEVIGKDNTVVNRGKFAVAK